MGHSSHVDVCVSHAPVHIGSETLASVFCWSQVIGVFFWARKFPGVPSALRNDVPLKRLGFPASRSAPTFPFS